LILDFKSWISDHFRLVAINPKPEIQNAFGSMPPEKHTPKFQPWVFQFGRRLPSGGAGPYFRNFMTATGIPSAPF